MVRGRGRGCGRGRGRLKNEHLTTFGSSVIMGKQVITPLLSAMQLTVQPGTSEGSNPMKELDLSSPVGPSTDLVSGEQTPIPTHSVDLEIEVETDEPGATWASLFKDNRSAQNGMNLTYIPPKLVNGKIVVQLDENEVEQEAEKWKCALIVFVIGEKPGFNYMRRYIEHYWKDIADPAPESMGGIIVSPVVATVTSEPIPTHQIMLDPGARGLQQNLKVNEQQGPMKDKGKLVATTSVFSEDKFPEL
ncbi:hypothetical protein H5410_001226 [Solanum commersonii]|uniref:Uncharacterized protein n=1 Tax=Solanum commersonii TaxID=4109 RepID=A0A9J6AY29_SOLCO|nr:hypothetical protein H5410_001226 [Solanum commersonii]